MNQDDGFQKLRPHLWWMIPLLILGAVFLITGFDPVGNLLGPQGERIAQIAVTVVVVGYIIFLAIRRK